MKKTNILMLITAFVACNNSTMAQATKTNKVLWAEKAQSTLPLERDTLWNIEEWNAVYKYDKKKIFESITHAVESGKLKAYADYPNGELTIKKFNNILVKWDSTNYIEDVKNPGTMIISPMKKELKPDDIVQIKFNERIELDTVSYILNKIVSSISFFTYKYDERGEVILSLTKIFDVKLNEIQKK